MAKVVDAARITSRDGTVWRTCSICGTLGALAPDIETCPACVVPAAVDIRRLVGVLAAASVREVRTVHTSAASDAVRVAALVEIAGAAATLARLIAKNRHVDPEVIAGQVRDRTDAYAVLGRGRWLPTMTRHVPRPRSTPMRAGVLIPLAAGRRKSAAARTTRTSRSAPVQGALFDAPSTPLRGAR
jgi:hypothetical protein